MGSGKNGPQLLGQPGQLQLVGPAVFLQGHGLDLLLQVHKVILSQQLPERPQDRVVGLGILPAVLCCVAISRVLLEGWRHFNREVLLKE